MIRLATRLTAGGGRSALVRMLLTGAGQALAVTMLLFAAVAYPALHAHDVRRAWTGTSAENEQPAQDEATTDPLLWRLTEARYDGDDLLRVDVAAEGPEAPVPPGLVRLPGPGEIVASPRLAQLLDGSAGDALGGRFPGQVTATVGRDALASSDDLVVFVGRSPEELRAEDEVSTVRSIESKPVSHYLTRDARIALTVGGVGLLVPIVVFVATATRLAAARREQRLAALRLTGATPGQVGLVAAVEAAIAAVGGTAAGFAAFLAIRPSLARVPLDGASFYPSDLHLSPAWAALIGLGVPALAVGAAVLSLRRVRITPLGVTRRATPSRATPWPLLLVAAGLAVLGLAIARFSRGGGDTTTVSLLVGAAFLVTIVGLALSGPWLTSIVGRAIARCGRRAPSLLAARRLQDNPAAGFRSISGIVLAVFVGTVLAALAASTLGREGRPEIDLAAGVVVAAPVPDPTDDPADEPPGDGDGLPELTLEPRPELHSGPTADLLRDLRTVPGVDRVVTAHGFPDDPDALRWLERAGGSRMFAPVTVSCADAAALGFGPSCDGSTVVSAAGKNIQATGLTVPQDVAGSSGRLDDRPVVAVAAVTDGQAASVEQARSLIEHAFPGTPALTRSDIEDEVEGQTRTQERLVNMALAVTLIIAGCSLAVAVAGAIVERRQPLTLLRLAGTRLADLHRMVLAEAAAPLLMVTAASVALGFVVAELLLTVSGRQQLALPGLEYWLALAGGLGVALLVVMATLPLLDRLTALDSARFE